MSQDIADMPGIDAAMERFNAMVPAAPATTETADSTPTTRIEKPHAEAAAEPLPNRWQRHLPRGSDDTAQNSVTSTPASAEELRRGGHTDTDTPAAAVSGDEDGKSKIEDGKANDAKLSSTINLPSSQQKTRYAKAQERLEKTWETVNKRKSDLDSQAQQLEQQRQSLERDKAQLEAVRRQAEQPSATPEQAVQAAQAVRRDADALRMRAKRAEDAGRPEEAQKLNKQADRADAKADELGEYAEQLRKNPPASMQQRAQQFEQARKQWTLEACNVFPELSRNGSRLQQVVAQHLNELAKQDPQLLVHPSMVYHVARLADAQIAAADLKTVAARVPVLEKEAESLRARIKELEAAATPAGNGGVPRLGQPAQDDYTSLRQSAAEMGPLFR